MKKRVKQQETYYNATALTSGNFTYLILICIGQRKNYYLQDEY